MKIIRLIIVLFFTNVLLFADHKEDRASWNFGISTQSSVITKFKDAKIALTSWLSEMGEIYDVNITVEYYDSSKVLYEDFKKRKVDIIVLDTPFYFTNKKSIEKYANDSWSLSIDGDKFSQFYLIGNKTKSLNGFEDLRNKTLALKKEDEIVKYWLNMKSFKENKKHSEKMLKGIVEEKNDRRVLLSVFFGKSDFGIITKKAWEDLLVFNPAIKKRVEILEKSDKIFIPFIGLHSKWTHEETIRLFYEVSQNLSTLKGGEKLIDILKFNSVYKLDEKTISSLEKYFQKYFELENKYR